MERTPLCKVWGRDRYFHPSLPAETRHDLAAAVAVANDFRGCFPLDDGDLRRDIQCARRLVREAVLTRELVTFEELAAEYGSGIVFVTR